MLVLSRKPGEQILIAKHENIKRIVIAVADRL